MGLPHLEPEAEKGAFAKSPPGDPGQMASRGAAAALPRCLPDWSFRGLLWVGAVASSLLGAFSDPRRQDPRQLHATLRGSVLLSAGGPSDAVTAVEWDFQVPGSKRVLLVETRTGKPPEIHSENKFGPRLEVINVTCLRIRDLAAGDGGVFGARVKSHGGVVSDYSFALTLHEPVPSPQVNCSVLSRYPEGCNVTLHCQGTGNGEFEISWTKGDPPQALEEGGSDRYWLSDNGTVLQMLWHFGSSHSLFTCLISNAAAEEKRASLGVASCCRHAGANEARALRWLWCLPTIVVAGAVLVGSLWVWAKKRKRTPTRGPSVMEEQPDEAKYSVMRKRAGSPESSCGQPRAPLPHLRPKPHTVYAELQSDAHVYDAAT